MSAGIIPPNAVQSKHIMTSTPDSAPPAGQPPRSAAARTVALLRRLYRWTRGLLALGMVVYLLLILTPVTERLYLWLAVTAPAAKADAIICLGGGNTVREVRAVELYHRGCAPQVIVSNLPGAAQGMRDFMVEFGVPRSVILVDDRSRVTADHPAGIARLPGVDTATQHFIIVTDHSHSRRVRAVFQKAGYRHFTIYAGRPADRDPPNTAVELMKWRFANLPRIVYEYAGLTQYWFQGRL